MTNNTDEKSSLYVPEEFKAKLQPLAATRPLSRRELEISWLKAQGKKHKEIAKILGIEPGTVHSTWTQVCNKIHGLADSIEDLHKGMSLPENPRHEQQENTPALGALRTPGTVQKRHIDVPEELKAKLQALAGRRALTERELEVAWLKAQGKSHKEIAETLGIEKITVKNTWAHACNKIPQQTPSVAGSLHKPEGLLSLYYQLPPPNLAETFQHQLGENTRVLAALLTPGTAEEHAERLGMDVDTFNARKAGIHNTLGTATLTDLFRETYVRCASSPPALGGESATNYVPPAPLDSAAIKKLLREDMRRIPTLKHVEERLKALHRDFTPN